MNCSVSKNCSLLNRDHCLLTPRTCGSCLPGYIGEEPIYMEMFSRVLVSALHYATLHYTSLLYSTLLYSSLLHWLLLFLLLRLWINRIGIVGDSNVRCRSLTSDISTRRPIGSSCESDDDCLYGQCTNKICAAPVLLCPTNIPGEYVLSLSLPLPLSPFWCAYHFLTLPTPPYVSISAPLLTCSLITF